MQATYVSHSGDDLLVVNAARVSFDKYSKEITEKDKRLLLYLAKHNHWTPFAHPQITLHIKAPIFVRTQCFKHKVGFTENEISRRYVSHEPELFYPTEWRNKAEDKKQGSGDPHDHQDFVEAKYDEATQMAIGTYLDLIGIGVAPEQARAVLPQGIYTEWYWTGSLVAYARFYKLRTEETAQIEIQELAYLIGDIIQPLFPHSWSAISGRQL